MCTVALVCVESFHLLSYCMCMWDVLHRCEVLCSSQQNRDHYTLLSGREGKGWREGGNRGMGKGHQASSQRLKTTLSTDRLELLPSQAFFLLLFPSPFWPLQIMESASALTPSLFEMKEEITVLICAYFAFFWNTQLEIIPFTPCFA